MMATFRKIPPGQGVAPQLSNGHFTINYSFCSFGGKTFLFNTDKKTATAFELWGLL